MPKAVIYARVSSQEQVNNLSLSTQEKACREYCQKIGLEVECVYVEEGESAKTTERTKFREMLSFCKSSKGKVQYVVVYSVSRFSRQAHDHHVIRALLKGMGITLRSVTEPIDDSSTGKLLETLLAGFAQYDNDVRADRTVAGMRASLALGRWTHKPPLGYLRAATPKIGPSLVQDPERGPLVARAFELFATGLYTKAEVLRQVTALGLRTFKGKPVSMQTFNLTLEKPIYAGTLKAKRWNVESEANFKPLVDRETFVAVQAVLQGKRPSVTPYQRNNPDFPLRRFVTCKKCGRPLTGSFSKGRKYRYAYYRCPKASCRAVNVRKATLEDAFVAYLNGLTPEPGYLRLFHEVVLDTWKQKQQGAQDARKSLEKALTSLRERRDRLVEAFLYQRAIDQATYDDQRTKLGEDIALKEIDLNEQRIDELDVEGALNFAHHVLGHLGRLWLEFPLAQKQRLQRVLFPSGVQFADGTFGTAELAIFFKAIQPSEAPNSSLVTPTGFEPVLPP